MPDSIQPREYLRGGDMEDISRNPTAIRTCSTRTGTMTVAGSTPTMTDLTITGTTMVGSRLLSRNFLNFSPQF